jgi:hypothetical protein
MATSAVLPHRAGHFLTRAVFRTGEVIFFEDPGQPAGHTGTRRTTRVEDAPQLRTSSADGSHPGLRPGLEPAPTGHGRLSALLASVEVPTTRCVNRQRCACESRHDFRRACRVTSSDRRPARQGKAPTELPLHIEAVPAPPQPFRLDLPRRPVRSTRTSRETGWVARRRRIASSARCFRPPISIARLLALTSSGPRSR